MYPVSPIFINALHIHAHIAYYYMYVRSFSIAKSKVHHIIVFIPHHTESADEPALYISLSLVFFCRFRISVSVFSAFARV